MCSIYLGTSRSQHGVYLQDTCLFFWIGYINNYNWVVPIVLAP